jgi:hypothetical protein|nr:hypothetical protein Q903MT_gene799 [Picea sitchensis]
MAMVLARAEKENTYYAMALELTLMEHSSYRGLPISTFRDRDSWPYQQQ